MPQFDYAHEWTEKEIKRLAEKLRYHYRKAARELGEKAKKHLGAYEVGRARMAKMLDSGAITESEFREWCAKRAVMLSRDTAMIGELANLAQGATVEARRLISGAMPSVYQECADITTFTIDKAIGRNVLFSLVDRDTVLYMLQDNPWFLPFNDEVGLFAGGTKWHSQKLTSAITQGVLQGESVPQVAKRVQSVTDMDYAASERAARTALTCAENMGRQYSYERAIASGIKGQKKWEATLDGRTRDSHREMDGVTVGVMERFPNGLIEPADPMGEAGEVYNCRCTSVFVLEGTEDLELDRFSRLPDDVTYDEWKSGAYHTDRNNRETNASRNARTA